MIIDLKALNLHICKVSFKMEDRIFIRSLIEPGDLMVSIDLKDAFFLVPIHCDSKKFLTFSFEGVRYQFNVLPFGLSSAPRTFSFVLKPVINLLRASGIKISSYLDDIFICASSHNEISKALNSTLKLLSSLGFIINFEKSSLSPSSSITHLGFLWNSSSMSVSLPQDKCAKIRLSALSLLNSPSSLRALASFLGQVVGCSFGCRFAPLHYRALQFCLIRAIVSLNSWTDIVYFDRLAISDLKWWSSFSSQTCIPVALSRVSLDFTLFSDASNQGWGASLSSGEIISGTWSAECQSFHINWLELKAVFLAFEHFLPLLQGKVVHVRSDNSTAVSYINKMGGTHSWSLCALALELWSFLAKNSISCFASHIAGSSNVEADFLSRFSHRHEFSLSQEAFNLIQASLPFPLTVDLFASRHNKKLDRYVSLSFDSEASAVDAFSLLWPSGSYLFPPIPLISRAMSKFFRDEVACGIIITPAWPSLSPIFSIINSLVANPIYIASSFVQGCLPMRHAFPLMAWPISSNPVDSRVFRRNLPELSSEAWKELRSQSISGTGGDLLHGLLRRGIRASLLL